MVEAAMLGRRVVPNHWRRQLGGTLREQLAHLRVALAAEVESLPVSGRARSAKAGPALSEATVLRMRKRGPGGKGYAESAAVLAVALGVTRHRVETVRALGRGRV